MNNTVTALESRRLLVQANLDAAKDQLERNRMGQFATPTKLAIEILQYARVLVPESTTVRFIDPAFGTGAFYSALLQVFPDDRLACAIGYEIDPHYGTPAAKLWSNTILETRLEDFTLAVPPKTDSEKFNLLVCNPPYVRHHHIVRAEKQRLKLKAKKVSGSDVSGLAGLYCYFLNLSHAWMAEGGLAAWLIPSEFMDVNYGISVKRYLLDKVTLLHVHRFDPKEVQFGDALVSSSVVWIRKGKTPLNHAVRMTFGGSLQEPSLDRIVPNDVLRDNLDWTQYSMNESHHEPDSPVLSDYFRIQRGLATGNNKYFILSAEEIERRELPLEAFRPILPSPRYIVNDEVHTDTEGDPLLNRRLFLLDSQLSEATIKEWSPALGAYLEEGKAQGVSEGYLCRHRIPWYSQERRPAAPFLCTYIGRGKKNGQPFRFILNHSQATAPNSYLMLYPRESILKALNETPQLKRQIWAFLQEICPNAMIGKGRVYGGGLHKLEPKELGKVPAAALSDLLA
ncbi:MAG: SAM-dependent DNA methyltransferase [Dehalococcoidia bacterium]|nr:SAM-dependent DNA methyltransferase [Dehalococcoidia bacterium]